MAYDVFPLGQNPMSSSRAVVIASNQTPVSVAGTVNIGNNASVSGTTGSSIIGLPTVQTGNNSVITVVQGSVAVSVTPVANQSVSGSVGIVGNPSISGTVLINNGSVVAFQGTSPWIVGSVYGNISGSVVTFQGTSPWVVNFQNSSIIAINAGSVVAVPQGSTIAIIQGSVAAFQGGTQITSISGTVVIQSIVGTYAEDAPSTTADPGIFVLGVRNDTMASLVSANADYGALANDSQGRLVIKPFSPEDGTIISYTGSVVSTSVTLIQASAIGKRSYITDFWLSNTGAAATLVTFQDGSTSVLGYGIAPAGSGESSPGIAIPLKTAPSQDLAFKMGTGTSILYLTVKGYQAP